MSVFTGNVPLKSVVSSANVPQLYDSKGNYIRSLSNDEVHAVIKQRIDSEIAAQRGLYFSGWNAPESYFGCLGVVWISDQSPVELSRIDSFPKVKKGSGKAWRERYKYESIIMNNYDAGQILCRATPTTTTVVVPSGATRVDKELYRSGLYETKTFQNGAVKCIVLENGWYVARAYTTVLYEYGGKYNVVSGRLPSSSSVIKAFQTFMDSLDQDCNLTMSTYSDANRKTVDALTAMAETPETLRSIINACLISLRMYKEARNKAFRIYNKGKGNSNSATARKNLIEMQDAISDVWLNYRYNIMPNVYLIQDLIKTYEQGASEFFRYRNTLRATSLFDIPIEGYITREDVDVTHRSLVKRLVKTSGSFSYERLHMSFNPAVTAWELLPLSFVWDWFFTIGDYIAAMSGPPQGTFKEGTTYSFKVEDSLTFKHPDGSIFVADFSCYRRRSIDPANSFRITYNPNLNWKRSLDAIALTWKISIRGFVK